MATSAADRAIAPPGPGFAPILKKALLSALVALGLFALMIGVRTETGSTGQLTYWTRFGELAAMVGAVFAGSIVIELLRRWIGPAGSRGIVPPRVTEALGAAGSRRRCWCSRCWCR